MSNLGEGLKKVVLAGIGGAAITAEKSTEIIDEMAKKGEETVERGKVLNQELKYNIKKTVKENMNVSVKTSTPEELDELLEKMTPEQLAQLKERIQILESEEDAKDEGVKEECVKEEAGGCCADEEKAPELTNEECQEVNE